MSRTSWRAVTSPSGPRRRRGPGAGPSRRCATSRTKAMSCSTTTIVRPASFRCRSTRAVLQVSSGDMPAVGSSSSTSAARRPAPWRSPATGADGAGSRAPACRLSDRARTGRAHSEALLGIAGRRAGHRHGEVLPDGQVVIGAVGLEGQAQPEPHALEGRQARDLAALQQHAAGVGPLDAAEQREERRLAGAVRADDAAQPPRGSEVTSSVATTPPKRLRMLGRQDRRHRQRSARPRASRATEARGKRRRRCPCGKNSITTTSSAPMITSAY